MLRVARKKPGSECTFACSNDSLIATTGPELVDAAQRDRRPRLQQPQHCSSTPSIRRCRTRATVESMDRSSVPYRSDPIDRAAARSPRRLNEALR